MNATFVASVMSTPEIWITSVELDVLSRVDGSAKSSPVPKGSSRLGR
jgi:hypothetical protein